MQMWGLFFKNAVKCSHLNTYISNKIIKEQENYANIALALLYSKYITQRNWANFRIQFSYHLTMKNKLHQLYLLVG